MAWIGCVYLFLFLHFARADLHEEDSSSNTNIPPCAACNLLVNSFLSKFKDNSQFEVIHKKTCSGLSNRGGETQCKRNAQDWLVHLKEWFDHQKDNLELKTYLCIHTLQVCCPDEHFGTQCQKCLHYGENGKVCSGNGKCKGAGTRKGNGACLCDSGFDGPTCDQCSNSHYLSYQDAEKTLCSPCHHSCNGDCSGAGPTKCFACRPGFVMHAEHGCQDIGKVHYEKQNIFYS